MVKKKSKPLVGTKVVIVGPPSGNCGYCDGTYKEAKKLRSEGATVKKRVAKTSGNNSFSTFWGFMGIIFLFITIYAGWIGDTSLIIIGLIVTIISFLLYFATKTKLNYYPQVVLDTKSGKRKVVTGGMNKSDIKGVLRK